MGATGVFRSLRFGSVRRAVDSDINRRLVARGGTLYSMHKFNFVRVRHGDHTYNQDDENFLANSHTKPHKKLDFKQVFSKY
mgnify:CR=1 FL=1